MRESHQDTILLVNPLKMILNKFWNGPIFVALSSCPRHHTIQGMRTPLPTVCRLKEAGVHCSDRESRTRLGDRMY